MKNLHAFYHLAIADFRERTRQYSFLITLGLISYLGFLVNNGQLTLRLGDYRGEFNSAWVGSMMALVVNVFLSLIGFYLLNNCIKRDLKTGVGQIIAATPIRKTLYLYGKWASNFLLLAVMVLILAIAAVILQIFQGDIAQFDFWALIAPFIFISLPMMAFTAAIAILFESIRWLSGGFGNIVYFFLFMFMLLFSFELLNSTIITDPFGFSLLTPSMMAAASAMYPEYAGGFQLSISTVKQYQIFPWEGIQWTFRLIFPQLLWFLFGLILVLFSALFFHRFDPSLIKINKEKSGKKKKTSGRKEKIKILLLKINESRLLKVFRFTPNNGFLVLVKAELKLMLKGLPWWYWTVFVGLIWACLVSPIETVRAGLLPVCWIWPILIWSKIGCREKQFNTTQIVFSASESFNKLFPATLLAGMLVTALAGSGAFINFMIHQDLQAVVFWIIALFFIPSLAFFTGVWSENNKLFEVVYLILWYIGPLNRTPLLDFIGTTDLTPFPTIPITFGIISLVLLILTALKRKQQIRS